MTDNFNRIEQKLDKIDNKLDNHLERLVQAENSISWLRGHLKLSLSFALSIILFLFSYIIKQIL